MKRSLKLLSGRQIAAALAVMAIFTGAGALRSQTGRDAVAADAASGGAARRVSFVTCPVVRDTKTVPVWLAEYEGQWYYLGIQQDISAEFHPPQLKHEVLVEGTISDEPKICGGIVLRPLTISVMRELNNSCNTILPAEEGFDAPPAPRPAGPATHRREPEGRGARAARPSPPFKEQEFRIQFSFDDDYLPSRSTRILSQAADYALASRAKRVEVRGYRATSRLSNGRDLVEREEIADLRASKIGEILVGLGLPESSLSVAAKSEPEAGNGITDAENRRVTIRIIP
jgi:outer membrane protein OmpA-like peptidoglycan-associated protein